MHFEQLTTCRSNAQTDMMLQEKMGIDDDVWVSMYIEKITKHSCIINSSNLRHEDWLGGQNCFRLTTCLQKNIL